MSIPQIPVGHPTTNILPRKSRLDGRSSPIISIIIVNYNSGNYLLDSVESVEAFTSDYELIIVDNGSIDDSLRGVSQKPLTTIIKSNENLGFAKANNRGIIRAKGKFIALLNSDTKVTRDWLANLRNCLEEDPRIGLCTPKLVLPEERLDSTGHIFKFSEATVSERGARAIDTERFDKSTELISCGFGCVLIRRSLLEEIGLLDEAMFFYFEDVDFCVRAKLAGWRVVYCPSSVVDHYRGGSTSARTGDLLIEKSRPYSTRIILKNYEPRNALLYGGRQILLWILGMAAGIRNRNLRYAGQNANRLFWILSHIPLRERQQIQRVRKATDRVLMESCDHP